MGDFTRDQFVKAIQTMAKMGVRGSPLRALIEPAILIVPHLKSENLAIMAYAFERLLGSESAPLMKEIIGAAMPMLEDFTLRRSLSLVSSLMRSQVVENEAMELFNRVGDVVAGTPKEANAA